MAKQKKISLENFTIKILEKIFKIICDRISYYRDKPKVNIPFRNTIITHS